MSSIVGMGFATLQKQDVMVILTADSVQKAHLQMKRIVVRTKVDVEVALFVEFQKLKAVSREF